MIKTDFYSGLPVNEEPSNVLDVQTIDQNNAAIRNGYATDPNQRFMQISQQQQQVKNPFVQSQYYPQQQFQPSIPYQPYMSPYRAQFQQGNSFGFAGNPVFGMYGQQNNWGMQYMQPQFQERTVHVPGLNFGSGRLLSNAEEVCDKLQVEMMMEQEEAACKRQERFQGYFNNNGYNNYYGMPYYNSYYDTSIYNKYRGKIDEMRKEAIERRIDFNKNLKRLCNNILGQEMSEEDLDSLYRGYDYTIPASQMKAIYENDRFSKMVPVSNQQAYANNFQNLHNFYDGIMQQMDTQDLNGFLGALGIVQVCDNLEQEIHNRKDGSRLYDSNSYKRYLRRHIAERNGMVQQNNNQQFLNPAQAIDASLFPTMSQSGSILDDGTISITAPPWLGGSTGRRILVNNEMEQHFEENRRAFLNSIYSQGV